jgi:hypothetical protein
LLFEDVQAGIANAQKRLELRDRSIDAHRVAFEER